METATREFLGVRGNSIGLFGWVNCSISLNSTGGIAMNTEATRFKRLNILAVLNPTELYDPGLFSVLRSHIVLVCQSATQALQAVPGFAPDVILVDLRVHDADALIQGFSTQSIPAKPVLVALRSSWSQGVPSAGFDHEVTIPISSDEIASLLQTFCDEEQPDCYLVRSSA